MSSGTYFPPPVRSVAIPKKDGGERRLGIPTVSDRVAQTVVKMYLEPEVEPHFHADSYGYRQGKSAVDALTVTRQRCWRYDWVIDLDVRAFFDNLDHALVLRAVGKYTQNRWILLYVERWLQAPVQLEDGTLVPRTKGTPQGGVVSPLLANIFLHLSFDDWMRSTHPDVPFERYADDIVAHCKSEEHTQHVLCSIKRRLERCRLEVHPDKTRIVYFKDDDRKGGYPNEKFNPKFPRATHPVLLFEYEEDARPVMAVLRKRFAKYGLTVVSPILANIFLHEVLDVWMHQEVRGRLRAWPSPPPRSDCRIFVARMPDSRQRAPRKLEALLGTGRATASNVLFAPFRPAGASLHERGLG
jgi:retron-type reverse transcriptase